jgi:Protein of unknown function (DUF2970)
VSDLRDATQRPASLLQTMRAVAWSFFGVRRSSDYAQDVAKLNPVHVVIGGIVGAALFVLGVFLLVRWVVTSGVAA